MVRAVAPSKRTVPLYAEQDRISRVAHSSKVGYFKAKSRKQRYMKRRAPVRDSKRAYRCGVMKTAPLGKFASFMRGPCYRGPCISRVGKTVAESQHETEALPYIIDLVDLTKEAGEGILPPENREVGSVGNDIVNLPEVIVLYDTSDDEDTERVSDEDRDHQPNEYRDECCVPPISPSEIINLVESGDESSHDETECNDVDTGCHDEVDNACWTVTPDIIYLDESSDEKDSRSSERSTGASETGENEEANVLSLQKDKDVVPWPTDVVEITNTENPNNIVVPDLGPMDWCGCDTICRPDSCPNALGSIFCARNNCLNGSDCGNRLRTMSGLHLARGSIGYSVITSEDIESGSIVAEYAGVLTTHDYRKDKKRISNYTIGLATRSSRKMQTKSEYM
ncbi:hypothetical protein DVH05_003362 [Phytophthora capsici]|nr:hypothetical protein DVH05_003362 [Phytophthora capsici]